MSYVQPHHTPSLPPQPPPRDPEPEPRWPAWYAPAGFGVALGATFVTVAIVAAIAAAAGADLDASEPAITIVFTLIQDTVLVGTAVFFAALTLPPRAWHFGLVRTRLWPAVGWSVVAMLSFYVLVAAYAALVEPDAEQTVAEDLGADRGTLALVVAGLVVIAVAPVAEELFFRGFFYRALRTRLGVAAAALIDGALFGAIHFTGPATLELLPILTLLGVVFCLLYERTSSLYPVIALHAFNNSIAFSVATEGSAGVSLALGALVIAGTIVVPRVAPGRQASTVDV